MTARYDAFFRLDLDLDLDFDAVDRDEALCS
jgi:hypothetical protein